MWDALVCVSIPTTHGQRFERQAKAGRPWQMLNRESYKFQTISWPPRTGVIRTARFERIPAENSRLRFASSLSLQAQPSFPVLECQNETPLVSLRLIDPAVTA